MYNLIVTAQEGAWNKSLFEIDKGRCIVGFSDDEIVDQYAELSPDAIEKAKKFVTLFCYEDFVAGNPKIGFITSISMRGRNVRLRFDAHEIGGVLSTEKLKSIDDQLEFLGGELNRSHWAIKNADLINILIRSSMTVPELIKLRSTTGLSHLQSATDFANHFTSMLISRATGEGCDPDHYKVLRNFFMLNSIYEDVVPEFIKDCADHNQFLHFIKPKFARYEERRIYLRTELSALTERAKNGTILPSAAIITEKLRLIDSEGVNIEWQKAIDRSDVDPSGAITSARTLLETVCKHILDSESIEYDSDSIELNALYREVAKTLNLTPENHKDLIYKQILGGCSGIINGLGSLRNKMGDAHGKGIRTVKPKARHAQLAVNLSGGMCQFLIQTYSESKNDRKAT
ncbi:MAG: abortive infection family protein [Fibrobacteres bacterium]|nr:abortive infection family protein [Fibrobacterota bacterium]